MTAGRKVRYKVVATECAEELEKLVQELIDQGWELQGGLSCGRGDLGDLLFAQALVKR